MKGSAIPENEAARLEALRRYNILDTTREKRFDDIVKLASYIGQTPIALVSFVDRDRQWFKSAVGLATDQTDRDVAFCAHAILQSDLFVVEDALADGRFAHNPLVTGEPHIRFYAGAPLLTPDGYGLGALCVMDRQPHRFSSDQRSALMALARVVIGELEQRRTAAELAGALAKVKTLHGLLPMCSHCKGIRNDHGYWLRLEAYLEKNTDAHMTHGICPKCLKEHFPLVAEALGESQRGADERQGLSRLLETHSRLVTRVQQKAQQIQELYAVRKVDVAEDVHSTEAKGCETRVNG